jgi:hypothetical protein
MTCANVTPSPRPTGRGLGEGQHECVALTHKQPTAPVLCVLFEKTDRQPGLVPSRGGRNLARGLDSAFGRVRDGQLFDKRKDELVSRMLERRSGTKGADIVISLSVPED